jgi:hypothetical protein
MPLWRAALIIHFVFLSFPFFLNALMSAGILPAFMFAGFQPACAEQGITAGPPARCRQKRMPLWRAALIIHFVFLSFPFFLNALMSAGILPAFMFAGFQPAAPVRTDGRKKNNSLH